MTAPLYRVFLPDGSVDWEMFQDLVRDSNYLVYDPPQKKRSFFQYGSDCINFFTPRSPYGVGFPCCLAETVRAWMRCKGHDVQHAHISEPDEWFLGMMEPPPEGNSCPELLRGVWWMKDNVANETLLSFESAHWGKPGTRGEGVGVKSVFRNWSKGSSLWGTLLARQQEGWWAVFQVSPDSRWVNLGADNWIYVLQPGDKLVDVNGKPVSFTPGNDFLRLTWNDGDPKKGLFYQYLVRRVAIKDENGKVQKVQPAYDELLNRATRPTVPGVCCNLFLCNIPDAEYGSAYDSLDDHQIYIPGPEINPPWLPSKLETDETEAIPRLS